MMRELGNLTTSPTRAPEGRAFGNPARPVEPANGAAFLVALLSMLAMLSGCKPAASTEHYTPPDKVLSFEKLFEQNCEGCHGRDGHFGPAPVLNDSLFVHVISDDQLRQVISDGRRVSGAGRRGTLMPAHAKERGGNLTSEQIGVLVTEIRKRWGATPVSGPLPRYAVATTAGAAASSKQAGQELFVTVCARCHGSDGQGGDAGPLHDATFLALVSRQLVRRTAIVGRPDLGMPDFRKLGETSALHHPLTTEEITDIVTHVESWGPAALGEAATQGATQPATRGEP